MPTAPLPDELRLLAPRLTENLVAAIVAIQALIAHHFLRHPIFQPAINPLWYRLNRARHCLTRLATRIQEGRPLPTSRAGQKRNPTAPPRTYPPIPRTYGWLLKALTWHVALHRNRLERLLAEPGMTDLVAATPSLGRILRPIGHMLALPVPALPRKRPARRPARPNPPPAPATSPQAVIASPCEAIHLRPRTAPPNTTSPFRSLTLKRERYICTHSQPD